MDEQIFIKLFCELVLQQQNYTEEQAFNEAYRLANFADLKYSKQKEERERKINENMPSPYRDTGTYILRG